MRIVGGYGVSLGGLDLMGVDEFGVSWKTNAIEDWDAPPGNTAEVVQNQFADGGHLTPGFLEPKTVRLVGRLLAPDRPSARAAIYRLTRLLPLVGTAIVAVSEDGTVTHRVMKVEGAPKIPRPTDVYASFDLLLTAPDSRLFSGDGSTPYQHSATAFLPSTSGGLQVLGAEVLRTNLATNPSFEVNTAGWVAGPGVSALIKGARLVSVNGTATPLLWGSNYVTPGASPAIPGQWVAVALRLRRSASVGLHASLTLRMRNSGTQVSESSHNFSPLGPEPLTDPATTKLAVFQVPTGANEVSPALWFGSSTVGGTPPASWVAHMTEVIIVTGATQAEAVANVAPYFDGSTPSTASRTYAWTGSPNDSASTESSVGGIQAPFQITASVVNGSVTVTASGDAPPPVLVRINGPVVQPIIRDELGGQMPLDISLSAGQWLDVDLDARTIKINSQVNRRNLLRGPWITPRPGMVLSLDAAVYNPATSMTVHWTDASN